MDLDGKDVHCSVLNTKGMRTTIYKSMLTEVRLGPSLGMHFAINSKNYCVIRKSADKKVLLWKSDSCSIFFLYICVF